MTQERGLMTVQLGNSYAKLYGTSYEVSDIGALTVYDGDDEIIVYPPASGTGSSSIGTAREIKNDDKQG